MQNFDLSNRQDLNALRDDLNKLLKTAYDESNVSIEVGRIKYSGDGSNATITLEVGRVAGDGTVETKPVQDYRRMAPMYGLKAEHLGKSYISTTGKMFRVTGLNPRNRRYPILVDEVHTGKGYKVSAESVKSAFGE